MIKKVIYVLIVFTLIFSFNIQSFSSDFTEELMDNIDDETKDYLSDLGIDEISFEKLFELSPTRIFDFVFSLIAEKSTSLIDKFILVFVTLIISALSNSFLKESTHLNKIIDYISILIVLSYLMESVGRFLTDVIVCIKVTNVFINAYLPIMVGMLVASRKPALAVTYNSYIIILSNIISVFADKLFLPIISVLFSFNIKSAHLPIITQDSSFDIFSIRFASCINNSSALFKFLSFFK